MKSNSPIRTYIVSLIFIFFNILCLIIPVLGQSNFVRNDNYDFSGKHYI